VTTLTQEEKTKISSIAKTINDFFSRYTCASYVETSLSVLQQARLHIENRLTFAIGISESSIYIWNSRTDTHDYIPLSYTREELRREMRKIAQHLVWYLQTKERQEQQEFANSDWGQLVENKRGNRWDGYSFRITANNTSFVGNVVNSKLTLQCDSDDNLQLLLSALTGNKIVKNAVLPKTEALSGDGLMAKIDKYLSEE
jgi:hypothetical protein